MRLLLMEGNTLEQQREAVKLGIRPAGTVYRDAIERQFPSVRVDTINAAEPHRELPGGASLGDYDGLVVSGSSLHAYEPIPEVTRQIDLLRSFADTGKPILGSCWGLQLAIVAAGGEVAANPNGREMVFARKITLNPQGRAHHMFHGKPASFDAPSVHYDEVTGLPSGARVLCSNSHTRVQGATLSLGHSEVWAVQYHPEFDLTHIHDTVALYGDSMVEEGFFENDAARAAYQDLLRRLAADPPNRSLARQLGIGEDLLNDSVRGAEIGNWVRYCVLGFR